MSTDSVELARCPFCGGCAGVTVDTDNLYRVECRGCTADVLGADRNDAISKWNRRASPIEAPGQDMVMVPLHPTPEMRAAAQGKDGYMAIYRAMIDAFLKGAPNAASVPPDSEKPTHRHVKRGSDYVLIGYGKMQAENWTAPHHTTDQYGRPMECETSVDMREVAIYRSVDDGSLWARPREEFEDGRFLALLPSTGAGND